MGNAAVDRADKAFNGSRVIPDQRRRDHERCAVKRGDVRAPFKVSQGRCRIDPRLHRLGVDSIDEAEQAIPLSRQHARDDFTVRQF